GAVDRDAQAVRREGESMPRGQLGVKRTYVESVAGDLLLGAARGIAQRSEIQQPVIHRALARLRGATFPASTSRLPPDFSSSRTRSITISCDSALHMSYTVSAATLAPVRASISTPVLCVIA